VRIEFGERADLIRRNVDRRLQHKPCDALAAGRSCLRSPVGVVPGIVGQQTGGIYRISGNLHFFAFSHGHMFPKLLNGGVRAATLEKNCHRGHFPVAGRMHQVNDHIVGLAVDVLLAGTVKVELRQLVALIAHNQEIAISRRVIDSHRRMAVVDNSQRTAFVFESYGEQSDFVRASDVDGRLLLAELAGSVVRIQIAPMIWTGWPCIAPWCFPLRAGSAGQ
jgi:hypothetical protein